MTQKKNQYLTTRKKKKLNVLKKIRLIWFWSSLQVVTMAITTIWEPSGKSVIKKKSLTSHPLYKIPSISLPHPWLSAV